MTTTVAYMSIALVSVIALHIWTVWQYRVERSELLSRIMAKDLRDFQVSTQKSPPPKGGNYIKAGLRRREVNMEDVGSTQK